jgi:hypothetical protein
VKSTILLKHLETEDVLDHIDSVLATPDEIRQSTRDKRVVLYYRFNREILNGKWIAIVVKQVDRNFISTIYLTDQIKAGEVLWKKNS